MTAYSSDQIEKALIAAGIPSASIALLDDQYLLPDRQQLGTLFVDFLKRRQVSGGLRDANTGEFLYVNNRQDCDKAARKAWNALDDWFDATIDQQPRTFDHPGDSSDESGLAFGLIGYKKDVADIGPIPHAINLLVYDEGTSDVPILKVAFFEPQFPGLVDLTAAEIGSTSLVYV